MFYTAIITHFSEREDGRWLTTGEFEVVRDLERSGVEQLVADRAGPGIQFDVSSHDQMIEAESAIGGRDLRWIDHVANAERDRAMFAAIAAAADGGEYGHT
jgi:hypothetical protein